MRNTLYLFCLLLAALAPMAALATESQGQADQQQGWVVMPAGARPAYFGIHGGTMPVSLLVYGDGSSLVTFVGRTGNDFIDMLRRAEISMPSLLNATSQRSSAGKSVSPSANATAVLMAGSSSSSLPVFNVSGEGLSRMDVPPGQLQPFGLSDKALSIEGEVTAPQRLSTVKQYRLLFQPQYLQPRRNQR